MKNELVENRMLSYMKNDDLYLARWLAARNFHVDQARDLFLSNLKWREGQKMDTILNEDWREMEGEFPYNLDGIDKEGRPLLYIPLGIWNIRKMASERHLPQLTRYFARIIEEGDLKVRKIREGQEQGQSSIIVSQFTIILDLEGYSMQKQGCFQCLSFYAGLGEVLQSHFPRVAERIVFVNAPSIFQVTFDTVQQLLGMNARQSIEIFGPDRGIWVKAILEYLPRDQFPKGLEIGVPTHEYQQQQQKKKKQKKRN